MQGTADKVHLIRAIYVYVVSMVSLLFLLIGLGTVIYRSLQYYVFPMADNYRYSYDVCSSPKYVGTGEVLPNDEEVKTCEDRMEKNDQMNKVAQFQSAMLSGSVMIIIALPVYLLHFFYLRKKL